MSFDPDSPDETLSLNGVERRYAPSERRPTAHTVFTAAELQTMAFPPISFVVESVLAPGATLLAGRPKTMKSFLALESCVAVATGGKACGAWPAPRGDVLAFFCEDNPRRLKSRLSRFYRAEPWSKNFEMCTEAPRLGLGFAEDVGRWCKRVERPALVVVDTFNFIRPPRDRASYQFDYADAGAVSQLANELNIAILVITHQRKAEAEDPLDSVSGTTGIAGGFDSVLALSRSPAGGFVLHGRGRDLPEVDIAMAFDAESCRWRVLGDAAEAGLSETRTTILRALRDGYSSPKEISDATNLSPEVVKKRLTDMAKVGQVSKRGRGDYALSPSPSSLSSPLMEDSENESDEGDDSDGAA